MKKNLFKLFICLFFLFLTASSFVVSAKKVDIKEEDNPFGETVLTLGNREIFIEIDEETGFAYVCLESNGNIYILGTCEVVLVDSENPNGVVDGVPANDLDDYGTITISDSDNGLYISALDGEIVNYFEVNLKVVITE